MILVATVCVKVYPQELDSSNTKKVHASFRLYTLIQPYMYKKEQRFSTRCKSLARDFCDLFNPKTANQLYHSKVK